jgi:hypothetical protein
MERNRAAICIIEKKFLAIYSSYTVFIISYLIISYLTISYLTAFQTFTTDQQSN